MWVRHHTAACAGGERAPDGSAWLVCLGGEETRFDANPRLRVAPWAHDMQRLYLWTERGYLPDGGGVGDQPAIMLDAFDVMDSQEKECRAAAGERNAAVAQAADHRRRGGRLQ